MVQLDSPSILTVCLSKCLHGTGWCDSLVDNLSVIYYEKKKSRIPMEAILYKTKTTKMYMNADANNAIC